jgi:regulator of sirC expression with transglutaminase-like and TPR domain
MMHGVAVEPFSVLATAPDAPLDELALAIAAEMRPVDADAALGRLDELAGRVDPAAVGPLAELDALVGVLAREEGLRGDRADYDDPRNSMLDLVLERRRGLPILLSVVYIEVARRVGIQMAGFGLPGHFVCGHVGGGEALLIDPFAGGRPVAAPPGPLRPWTPHETATRMLNNLIGSYERRGDLTRAIRAAELRLLLPVDELASVRHEIEARALHARLN